MNESIPNKEGERFSVCTAEEKDAEALVNIVHTTWLTTYPNEEFGITVDDIEDRFIERRSEEGIEKTRKRLREQSDSTKTFVVKDGDTVIAMSVVSKDANENKLIAIYVLSEYQGRGVGDMLWKEMDTFFDTNKDVVVNVATYNTKAIAFYTRHGFKDSGKRITDDRFAMKSGAVIPEMEMRIKRK